MKPTYALVAAFAALSAPHASAAAVYTDPWDISQGATVLNHSGTYGEISNMFGNNLSVPHSGEQGFTLFQDWQPQGTVHWVEWQTLTTIPLTGYVLNLFGDETQFVGNRGISEFRLFGRLSESDAWQLLDTFIPPVQPYQGHFEHTGSFPEIELSQFRAEFVQLSNLPIGGPRVVELDAIVVPEPSSLLMAIGSSLFFIRRRKPSK